MSVDKFYAILLLMSYLSTFIIYNFKKVRKKYLKHLDCKIKSSTFVAAFPVWGAEDL